MKNLSTSACKSSIGLIATVLVFGLLTAAPTTFSRSLRVMDPSEISDALEVTRVKAERRANEGLPSQDNGLGRKCADINIGTVPSGSRGSVPSKNVVVVEGPIVQECP